MLSPDLPAHRRDVHQILQRLRKNHLYAKFEKYIFKQTSLPFLEYIISDPEKVSTVLKWPRPDVLKAIQRFLGFTNYYRQFIPHFSSWTAPIPALTHKADNPRVWTPEAESDVVFLKHAFSSASVLHRPDSNK
ncbi:uncharacterized protein [Phyllobates terribilis]|uniref:uncharacterized protein n=1 Tax=Phyllobates terribilis TaxID=111132 RepID=UPI003CCAF770